MTKKNKIKPPAGDAEQVETVTGRMAERFGSFFNGKTEDLVARGVDHRSAVASVIATSAWQLLACAKNYGAPRDLVARSVGQIFGQPNIPQGGRDALWEKVTQNFAEGVPRSEYDRLQAELAKEIGDLLREFDAAYRGCGMDAGDAAACVMITSVTQILRCMKNNDCQRPAAERLVEKVWGS